MEAERGEIHPSRQRILFINQYYWPDRASTAQHLTDLAESLAGARLRVPRALRPGPLPIRRTGTSGLRGPRGSAHTPGAGHVAGPSEHADADGRLPQLLCPALVKAMRLPRFDAVVTLTTPPIIGLIGTVLRRLKGTPHVYWSMDLHPDASLALRRMSPRNPLVRGSGVAEQLRSIATPTRRRAGPVHGRSRADEGVRKDRVATIPVWSRRDEVYPVDRDGNPLRQSLGLGDKFVAMYSGNLGLAHTFDEFLEAARRLRDREDIVFLFVGGGPRTEEVRSAQQDEGLTNIRLLDYVARARSSIARSRWPMSI